MFGNRLTSLSSLSNHSTSNSGGRTPAAGGLVSSLLNSNRPRSPDTSRNATNARRLAPGSPSRPVTPTDTLIRYVVISRDSIPPDFEDFQVSPQPNQLKLMPGFIPYTGGSADFNDLATKLMDHLEHICKYAKVLKFTRVSVPGVDVIEAYVATLVRESTQIENMYIADLEAHKDEEKDLSARRLVSLESERVATEVRDQLRLIPETESDTKRTLRLNNLHAANDDVDKYISRGQYLRDEEKKNKKSLAEVLLNYQNAYDKLKLQATAHRQNDLLALARLQAAIDMVFNDIEKILLLPAYTPIKAWLEKSREDPDNPLEPPMDHLKNKNLMVIHGVLSNRLRNADDKVSALSDLFNVVDAARRSFATDNDAYNYYLQVIRRLKAKGIMMVTMVDLMALLILVSMTKEKQDKFMAQQTLKEQIQGYSGSVHGSQADDKELTLMDLVVQFIDSLEKESLKRLALASVPMKEKPDHKAGHDADARARKAEQELQRNHQKVLVANAVKEADLLIKESIRKGIEAGLENQVNAAFVGASPKGTIQYCNAYQTGNCTRTGCRFVHEKDPRLRKPGAGGGGAGKPPPAQAPKIPAPNADGRIPRYRMWDAAGKMCCYQGPFFIETSDGPCQNTISCQYSHKKPIYTVKPEIARFSLVGLGEEIGGDFVRGP